MKLILKASIGMAICNSTIIFPIPPKGPRAPHSLAIYYLLYCLSSFEIQNLRRHTRETSMGRVGPCAWLPFHSISRHQINSSPNHSPSSRSHWEQPLLGKKKHAPCFLLPASDKKLSNRVLSGWALGSVPVGSGRYLAAVEEQ